ncbi:MAG: NAD-specific glutamate dehydrogenase, partial [Chlamydiae bacterium]|nr:NAD-specific glutamate dehydrogenase [Chlamydiota bacterium]
MKRPNKKDDQSKKKAVEFESRQFEEYYVWLQEHMPDGFFEEIDPQQYMLIAHYLMGFSLQDNFCQIQLKDEAFVLALDTPDIDVKILKNFNMFGIKNYQTFTSDAPPPFPGVKKKLKIATIYFTSSATIIEPKKYEQSLPKEKLEKVYAKLNEEGLDVSKEEFHKLIWGMNTLFLRSLSIERLTLALKMFFRARTRDYCQYEVRRNEDWKKQKGEAPSLRVVFAWRNTPKHRFLFRLAKMINRHNLKILKVNATYINPYGKNSILIMSLGLHGIKGKAAWEEADIQDFLQEMVTLKYFPDTDLIEKVFIEPGLLRGNIGNLLRAMASFVHQTLVHADINLYTYDNIEEGFCRHPELTVLACKAFELKFHPEKNDLEEYRSEKEKFMMLVDHLDTGNELNDLRRKNILKQMMHFVDFTLKTNFYRHNKSALGFRLDPRYLNFVPYKWREKFPELPFGIFFIQGLHFIGFHIRFKDLSRGGLRTVFPQRHEQMIAERDNVFSECYNLALTQQKKNKDIPEGGAKGVLFLEPYEQLLLEAQILRKELKAAGNEERDIEETIAKFKREQKIQYLYQMQRAFIHSLLTLVNCHDDGSLKAKDVVDYWKKPEYLYLGPDENMHNIMIEWIAEYSKHCGYKPGVAFISSKPTVGINHKEYGVTSLGVNVCMQEVLQHLGIDPKKDIFTIKMSGGPDGDVAGNQILNLYKLYPKTAQLLAITDVSGTIFDPKGLDLSILAKLFHDSKPLAAYPPKKLNDGGFLLDLQTKKEQTAYTTKTLCWRKEKGKLVEEWLSGSDMNHLYRHNLHQVQSDIFIPAGGRPRTLNDHNYNDFIDSKGKPTSRAIIEGANLYLTPLARRELEKQGVLIIKDSSANKGGVICSSMEVLAGLVLTEEEFLSEKNELMVEILAIIAEKARNEAQLLLKTHDETGEYLTDLSDKISEKINTFTYELLSYLDTLVLPSHPDDPLVKALLNFCPGILSKKYRERIIQKLPMLNKKAIIACYIASRLVYTKGVKWQPSIVDVLPLIASDQTITSSPLKNHT